MPRLDENRCCSLKKYILVIFGNVIISIAGQPVKTIAVITPVNVSEMKLNEVKIYKVTIETRMRVDICHVNPSLKFCIKFLYV